MREILIINFFILLFIVVMYSLGYFFLEKTHIDYLTTNQIIYLNLGIICTFIASNFLWDFIKGFIKGLWR